MRRCERGAGVSGGADIGRTIRSTVGCRLKRLVRVRVRVEVRVGVRPRVRFRLAESRLREAVAHAAHRSEPEDITATCDESTTLAVIMNNVCRKLIIGIENNCAVENGTATWSAVAPLTHRDSGLHVTGNRLQR